LTLGARADAMCMTQRAKFTEPCNQCWIEDHGCLASHCFNECVLGGAVHYGRLLGIVQSRGPTTVGRADLCIDCMERMCSEPFILGCGTNRRTAGVVTDIVRDEREHCDLS
jgi:hypothetical protein